jgi:hypothetical protein
MSRRSSPNSEKRSFADCSLTLRRSAGNKDGAESLDWEGGGITIDFDGLKITAYRVRAVSMNSDERLDHQLIDAIE